MEKEGVLQRFLDALPARFVVAENDIQMNTVLIDVDESTGRARSIERLNFRLDSDVTFSPPAIRSSNCNRLLK